MSGEPGCQLAWAEFWLLKRHGDDALANSSGMGFQTRFGFDGLSSRASGAPDRKRSYQR